MRLNHYKKFISGLLLCLFSGSIQAQDITGLWKGTLYNDTTGKTLRYEIGISQEKGKLTGFSHTFFIIDDQQYFGLKRIKIKKKGDKYIIEDVNLITNNYPVKPPKGVHQVSILELTIQDSIMLLTGPFYSTRNRDFHSVTGKVQVQRKNDFRQSALVPHLTELGLADEARFIPAETTAMPLLTKINAAPADKLQPAANSSKKNPTSVVTGSGTPVVITNIPVPEPVQPDLKKAVATAVVPGESEKKKAAPVSGISKGGLPVVVNKPVIKYEPASALNERVTEKTETVFFKSDSLQLTLYDNGEVDGDTVSVLLNGQLLLPMQGLSTKAIKKTIYISASADSLLLTMYAESLGSIPPNTGLLVVHDGADTYEVRFSADMNKNAAILFRRKR